MKSKEVLKLLNVSRVTPCGINLSFNNNIRCY